MGKYIEIFNLKEIKVSMFCMENRKKTAWENAFFEFFLFL